MPSIKVGSSQEILLEISQDLQVSFDSSLIGQLIDWAVEAINSRIENDFVQSFRNEKIEKNNLEPKYLNVDQSNLSYQYGNYLIKIKKELDLSNRNINIVTELSKNNFLYTPKYYGHLELNVFNKFVEFITIYDFIEDSSDGWTWLPQKIFNKDESWINPVSIICSQLHRDLRKLTTNSHEDFLNETEKIIDNSLIILETINSIDKNFPDPNQMFEIWERNKSRFFDELEIRRNKLSGISKSQVIHGDFHVGQILKSKDNFFVIDFDGSPVLNKKLRNIEAPREDDVAHLLTSIALAARVSERINQLEFGHLSVEVQNCQSSFLKNYLDNSKTLGLDVLNLDLVEYLRFRQYLFEIIYAINYLPRWLYAPIHSLLEELG